MDTSPDQSRAHPLPPHRRATAILGLAPGFLAAILADLMPRRPAITFDRRRFLQTSSLLVAGAALARSSLLRAADPVDSRVTLPFANGERELVTYPQKRPLMPM